MALRALIFGTDDIFKDLMPFYSIAVKRGDIEIVGYVVFEQGGIKLYPARGGGRKTLKS